MRIIAIPVNAATDGEDRVVLVCALDRHNRADVFVPRDKWVTMADSAEQFVRLIRRQIVRMGPWPWALVLERFPNDTTRFVEWMDLSGDPDLAGLKPLRLPDHKHVTAGEYAELVSRLDRTAAPAFKNVTRVEYDAMVEALAELES